MRTAETKLALLLGSAALALFALVSYLVFVFPGTISVWASEGRALSGAERFTAALSGFFQANGLLVLPLLFLGFLVCAVWAFRSARR